LPDPDKIYGPASDKDLKNREQPGKQKLDDDDNDDTDASSSDSDTSESADQPVKR